MPILYAHTNSFPGRRIYTYMYTFIIFTERKERERARARKKEKKSLGSGLPGRHDFLKTLAGRPGEEEERPAHSGCARLRKDSKLYASLFFFRI